MASKKNTGFTLIELIVVVVILGVLMAVLVPQYIQYVERSREGVCTSNRATVEREIAIAKATTDGELSLDEAKAVLNSHSGKAICPGGGEISVRYDNSTEYYTVLCSKHGDLPNREASKVLDDYLYIIENFGKLNPGENGRNDTYRNYYKKNYTKDKANWDTITVNGRSYFMQPYVDASSDKDGLPSNDVYIFANTSTGNNWNANLIYDSEVGKWYAPKDGKTIGFANQSWVQVKEKIKDWVPVEVIYN